MESRKTGIAALVAAWVLLLLLLDATAGGGAEAAEVARGEAVAWSTGSTITEAWKTLEVTVEPEPLPAELDGVWSRLVLSGFIVPRTFDPDRPACIGPCPALGNRYTYTGRGCNRKYQDPEC